MKKIDYISKLQSSTRNPSLESKLTIIDDQIRTEILIRQQRFDLVPRIALAQQQMYLLHKVLTTFCGFFIAEKANKFKFDSAISTSSRSESQNNKNKKHSEF